MTKRKRKNELMSSPPVTRAPSKFGGKLADMLTWLRILMTPVIMALVFVAWQPVEAGGIDLQLSVLASFLFLIAALTDIFDDYLGGNARSAARRFGFLDDVADTILICGVLLMLYYVTQRAGYSNWIFMVPVVIIVLREGIVGLLRGYELSQYGWPDTWVSNAKAGVSMLAVCLLLASPWLQNWADQRFRIGDAATIYGSASPWIWGAGEVCLWVAAFLSVAAAIDIFTPSRVSLEPPNLDEKEG